MKIELFRHSYHPLCTMGWLYVGSERFATIERPWKDNLQMLSCIPEGIYKLKHYSSQRFPETFEICDVPERSYILIHAGNTVDDVNGCVAVGLYPGRHNLSVQQSRSALERIRLLLKNESDMQIQIGFAHGAIS